jgi:hypothetical protein
MNKKAIISIFGAVVIAMMLIPGTIADDPDKPTDDGSTTESDGAYVDPDICLTSDDLPELRELSAQIEDDGAAQIVNQIISAIEDNGVVTGMQIGMMIYEGDGTGTQGIEIYSGDIDGTFPGSIWIPFGKKVLGLDGYLIRSLLPHHMFWSVVSGAGQINLQVGDVTLHEAHYGYALGFVGYARVYWGTCNSIEVHGSSGFILVMMR